MLRIPTRLAAVLFTVGLSTCATSIATAAAVPASHHVLLLSVDGLHQSDLDWYTTHHPDSALAALTRRGVSYPHAQTPMPSDSFPGMVGQVTGGNPSSTGVYYDDTYNHALLPAGTTKCNPGQPTGAEVNYTEGLDKNPDALDAGQGLSGLPDSILNMTGTPQSLIDPSKLPVDPKTCKPVYPHSYLQTNTIFEVARQSGLHTAWSDKHPAYDIFNGPSGAGVEDMFTPEINSQADGLAAGKDWASNNLKTRQYDGYKAQAVRNEIDGYDHSRKNKVGTPAVFGMNFQTVSTAQKLPTSDGLPGGYLADGMTPGPLLSAALDSVNEQVGSFVDEIDKQHLGDDTTVILSAKHGQSPTQPSALTRIPDQPILDALNAAWKSAHPDAGSLVAQATNDDGMLLWLTDRSQGAADFAKEFLLSQAGTGNDINGNPKPYTASGLTTVHAGQAAADYLHVPANDPRHPDIVGIAQHGVVFTGGKGKIAEHGGADPQDRNVPLVVAGAGSGHGVVNTQVDTTQIAPTILRLLGLDPNALQSVQREHTAVLPE